MIQSVNMLIYKFLQNFFCYILLLGQKCICETFDQWNSRIEQNINSVRKNDAKIVLSTKFYGNNVRWEKICQQS